MPFPYLQAKRISALRLAQILGANQGTLNTAYDETDINNMLDGAEIPALNFQDAILYIAKEIAETIAENPSHPARSFLYCVTAPLSTIDNIPTVDSNGNEILGVFDSCSEVGTNFPLTWVPTQTIADCVNSFFDDTKIYYYNITGNFIRTTRPSVFLQGCSWNDTDQIALYLANGDCPLPQSTLSMLCDGVAARATQVGWVDGAQVAPYYSQLYEQGLASLRKPTNMPISAQLSPVAG